MEDGEEERYTGEHNPGKAALEAAGASIRPNFDSAAEGEKDSDSSGKSLLKGAENAASSEKPKLGGKLGETVNGQRGAEEGVTSDGANPVSKIKNSVVGKSAVGTNGKGKGKGRFSKGGPIIAIILALCGFGGASFFSQSFMPVSLISQFQSNFDSIGTSINLRTKSLLKYQMDNKRVKTCTKSNIFDTTKFKVSSKQKKKLAANGITFDEVDGETVMKFKNSADDSELIVHAADFEGTYNTNQAFRDSYYQGAKTWQGSVSDWFDSLSKKFFNWIGLKRSNFADFSKSGDSDEDEANYKDTVKEEVGGEEGIKGDADSTKGDDEDDDGDPDKISEGDDDTLDIKPEDVDVDSNNDVDTSKLETGKTEEAVSSFANSKLGKFTNGVSAGASGLCAVFDTMGAISMIVVGYQTAQVLKTASVIFEGIQKGQIEDSSTAPIDEIANSLAKATTTSYPVGTFGSQKVTRTKSAMEANSVSALYGNTPVDTEDPSVKSFNIMSVLNNVAGFLKIGIDSFQACTYAKVAANVASVGIFVICAVTAGIGCLVDAGAKIGLKEAAKVAGQVALSFAIPYLVPIIAQVLTRKIATQVAGEDLGNALVSGANMYMGDNHQYGGGSVASKDTFVSYLLARDQVIAEKAQYDRDTLSPFDTSSQYTFMGSLLTSFIPVSTQISSVTSGTLSFVNLAGKSFSSLMPAASAMTAAKTAQAAADQTAEKCPYLASIGAVGDSFCNPYFMTDTSTNSEDPADVVNKIDTDFGGFEDSDGDQDVPTIKEGTKLANYIKYCGNRQSPYGMPDQNISSAVQSANTGNNVADTLIGMVPVVGDVVDLVNNTETLNNMSYITGEACVTGNTNNSSEASQWDNETKYYQRFVEDQRLAENMGLVEKSSVTAYLEKYYQEHPLDNSYEGILARYSGLTKENVVATLDTMKEIQFIANYHPANLYPTPQKSPSSKVASIQSNDNVDIFAVIPNLFFEEKTVRNFAA